MTPPLSPKSQAIATSILAATSSSSHSQIHFPNLSVKLDLDNNFSWKSVVFSTLEAFDIDEFVRDKPMDKPAEGENDAEVLEAYRTWRKKDHLVLVWLRSTLSERLLT
ncbi:hypothetical protein V2J09_013089 [Rumex salicifolius]